VKEKKESILIVKPKKGQESETTKKVVKEKVDIKNLAVGITKLRKGDKGTVIDCESESEMKHSMSEKLSKDFKIVEPKKIKPKLKVSKPKINIEEEEMRKKNIKG